MKNSKLSLTVGITTCYGDASILDTVKSVRQSRGMGSFQFIIVADREPLKPELKKSLKQYKVILIENKVSGSQLKKQKQILALAKTDLILFTQDDVLLDKNAIATAVQAFNQDPSLTMVSIANVPVRSTNFFEDVISVGTRLVLKTVNYWNNGDNYLSVIGRFMIFKKNHFNKFKLNNSITTTDAFFYFENRRLSGKYRYISGVSVFFKNPQNMKEYLRKSSRFQYSKQEMQQYFDDLNNEYKVPKSVTIKAIANLMLESPIKTILYLFVFFYSRIFKMSSSKVLNPVWEVDLSTKNLS